MLKALEDHKKHGQLHAIGCSVLTVISTNSTFDYVSKPKTICSLKELCGKFLLDNKISLQAANIPIELVAYLNTAKKCNYCDKVYFAHARKSLNFCHYEVICMQKLEGFPHKLPVYSRLCSENCLQKVKELSATNKDYGKKKQSEH